MDLSTLFEVEGLELHFLKKDGKLIFGCNFVKVKTVGLTIDNILEDFLFLDFFNSRSVSLKHVDFFVCECFLLNLFHYNNCSIIVITSHFCFIFSERFFLCIRCLLASSFSRTDLIKKTLLKVNIFAILRKE